MSDEQIIECSIHGKQIVTFVCQHLVVSLQTRKRVGFNSADDPGNPRPDSWCDECEKVVMEEGEWNDTSEGFAGVTMICAGCYDRAKRLNTTGVVCSYCGKVHDELPLDLGYLHPADYFKIPESQREARVEFNEDLCIIDGQEFYVRGILRLPIKTIDQSFTWGIWARVDKKDFGRYLELWNVDSVPDEPPFIGKLSGGIKYYPDSDLLDVTLHLQPHNKRPFFKVISEDHILGIDQREGITMEKVHQFLEGVKLF